MKLLKNTLELICDNGKTRHGEVVAIDGELVYELELSEVEDYNADIEEFFEEWTCNSVTEEQIPEGLQEIIWDSKLEIQDGATVLSLKAKDWIY